MPELVPEVEYPEIKKDPFLDCADFDPHFCDVVFVTAKTTESNVVLDLMQQGWAGDKPTVTRRCGGADNVSAIRPFDVLATFVLRGSKLRCALVAGSRQGPESAGIFVTRVAAELQPMSIVMVGICCINETVRGCVAGCPVCVGAHVLPTLASVPRRRSRRHRRPRKRRWSSRTRR